MRPTTVSALFHVLPFSVPLYTCSGLIIAATGTNPPSGNPDNYSGAGDWRGTVGKDHFVNQEGATISGHIDMRQGEVRIPLNLGTHSI